MLQETPKQGLATAQDRNLWLERSQPEHRSPFDSQQTESVKDYFTEENS